MERAKERVYPEQVAAAHRVDITKVKGSNKAWFIRSYARDVNGHHGWEGLRNGCACLSSMIEG